MGGLNLASGVRSQCQSSQSISVQQMVRMNTVTSDSHSRYKDRASPGKLRNHQFLTIHLRVVSAKIPKLNKLQKETHASWEGRAPLLISSLNEETSKDKASQILIHF